MIGTPQAALRLRSELDREQSRGFEVGATIVPDEWAFDPAALDAPYLCSLSEIGKAIDDRDLEALVVTREFERTDVDQRLFAEVVAPPRAGDGAPRVPRASLRLGPPGRDRLRVVHPARRKPLQAAHPLSQARHGPDVCHPGGNRPVTRHGGRGTRYQAGRRAGALSPGAGRPGRPPVLDQQAPHDDRRARARGGVGRRGRLRGSPASGASYERPTWTRRRSSGT